MARAKVCAGFLFVMKDNRAQRSVGQREDFEIAFAGEDHRQEAAVGRDVELADRDTAEDWLRCWCEDGSFFGVFLREEHGNINPDQVAGFSFDGALEHDAVFVGRPMENAEAYTEADEVVG